jgi:hypothetical protein
MGRIYQPTRADCSQSPQAQACRRRRTFLFVAFGMLDVLNATAQATKHRSQRYANSHRLLNIATSIGAQHSYVGRTSCRGGGRLFAVMAWR